MLNPVNIFFHFAGTPLMPFQSSDRGLVGRTRSTDGLKETLR